jgi:hypothetical protein
VNEENLILIHNVADVGGAFDQHSAEDGPKVRKRSAIMIKDFYSTMLVCLHSMLIICSHAPSRTIT